MSIKHDTIGHLIVAAVMLAIVFVAISFVKAQMMPRVNVRLGDTVFSGQAVSDSIGLERGLAGVGKLGENESMLLCFDSDSRWAIWMKDMEIPIDIIWLNSDHEVVYIVKNAQPDSYPDDIFIPKSPARYVLEVAAGTVDERKILIGDRADFDLGATKEWWQ